MIFLSLERQNLQNWVSHSIWSWLWSSPWFCGAFGCKPSKQMVSSGKLHSSSPSFNTAWLTTWRATIHEYELYLRTKPTFEHSGGSKQCAPRLYLDFQADISHDLLVTSIASRCRQRYEEIPSVWCFWRKVFITSTGHVTKAANPPAPRRMLQKLRNINWASEQGLKAVGQVGGPKPNPTNVSRVYAWG